LAIVIPEKKRGKIMKRFWSFTLIMLAIFSVFTLASDEKPAAKETEKQIEDIRAREKAMLEELRPKVKELLDYDIELLQIALKIKVIEKYQAAIVVSYNSLTEEIKYLGKIEDQFSSDSIFNEFGTYGSEFSSDSIWNKFGNYGSPFSSQSAFNKFTTNPPIIIKNKQVIGYLTVNKFIKGGVDPNWLKSFFVYQ
jgi:hypothetical protein